MKLNGEELISPFVNYSDIMAGGILEIEMTNIPLR
jgi:hypothetical protein